HGSQRYGRSDLRQQAGIGAASRIRVHSAIASSSMARRAGRQALDVVLTHELPADLELIAGRLVPHREHRLARTDEPFGRAVTLQTPLHLQAAHLLDAGHLVDASMARLAADTFLDVDGVVEIHEVGQIVHPYPLERLP